MAINAPPLHKGMSAWKKWTLASLATISALYAIDVGGRLTADFLRGKFDLGLTTTQVQEVREVTLEHSKYVEQLRQTQSQLALTLADFQKAQELNQALQKEIGVSQSALAQSQAKCVELESKADALVKKRVGENIVSATRLLEIRAKIKAGNPIKKLGNLINGNQALVAIDREIAMHHDLIMADEAAGMIDHSDHLTQSMFSSYMTLYQNSMK